MLMEASKVQNSADVHYSCCVAGLTLQLFQGQKALLLVAPLLGLRSST